MDYQNPIRFGYFLTPDASDYPEVLRRARLADSLVIPSSRVTVRNLYLICETCLQCPALQPGRMRASEGARRGSF